MYACKIKVRLVYIDLMHKIEYKYQFENEDLTFAFLLIIHIQALA